MTPPREIVGGRTVFITARAVARTYRFVPVRRIRNIVHFALIAIAQEYADRIHLHEYEFLSNHYHLLLTDVAGCLPDFMRDLNSLLARSLNAAHGVRGTCIEKGYNAVAPQDDAKVIEHAVYTLANACSAHLVRRTKQWEGPSSYARRYGEIIEIRRPKDAMWKYADEDDRARTGQRRPRKKMNAERARHRARTKFPTVARVRLVRPLIYPEMSDAQLRKHVMVQLDGRERALIERRRQNGKSVLGMRKVKRQSYWMSPESPEDMFGTTPSVSARSKWARIEALERRSLFVEAYRRARDAFRALQREVVFPHGTWLMKQRFNVCCHPPP